MDPGLRRDDELARKVIESTRRHCCGTTLAVQTPLLHHDGRIAPDPHQPGQTNVNANANIDTNTDTDTGANAQ
jgi:hypothetical protein